MSIADHTADIRRRLLATGISPTRLARMIGLSGEGLRNLKKDTWACRLSTLERLEKLLAELESGGSAAVVHEPNITDVSLDVCAENHSGAPRCGAATSEPQ